MNLRKNALQTLQQTSRTFYIPISRLPEGLQEAVTSAYLCMRAIDEIEDHPHLDRITKGKLLRQISLNLQSGVAESKPDDFGVGIIQHQDVIPEVSYRIGEWAILAPPSIAPRIWDATAAMADRMAYWAENNWTIHTKTHLDQYTFSVAGSVGLLLSDLWQWYDGTKTNRTQAIGFGRGLQAVNILRNQNDDQSRGVNYFPDGWTLENMHNYARYNLQLADSYTKALPSGPALQFCQIPLTLAHATLEVMALGKPKLTRSDVMALVEKVTR